MERPMPDARSETTIRADTGVRASSSIARRLLAAAADIMLPPRCLGCTGPVDSHGVLCGPCWRQIRFIHPTVCEALGVPLPIDLGEPTLSAAAIAEPPDYDRARAATIYDGTARRLIHLFKYSTGSRCAACWAAGWPNAGAELIADADLLVPVPLHPRRLLWRRYNQSALLALELGRMSGRPVEPFVLRRRRRTQAQVGLTEAQRRTNVAGAFAVPPPRRRRIEGLSVLLIDDVITTGATVNACARVLKRAGAARVDVLAVALVDARYEAPLKAR